jgi:hypothetical protein
MALFGLRKKYGFDHKKTWVCCKNLWEKIPAATKHVP